MSYAVHSNKLKQEACICAKVGLDVLRVLCTFEKETYNWIIPVVINKGAVYNLKDDFGEFLVVNLSNLKGPAEFLAPVYHRSLLHLDLNFLFPCFF